MNDSSIVSHLTVAFFCLCIGMVLIAGRYQPERNKLNNQCADQYRLIRRRISRLKTFEELQITEENIKDFRQAFINKAENDMVRKLSAELHALLDNQQSKIVNNMIKDFV